MPVSPQTPSTAMGAAKGDAEPETDFLAAMPGVELIKELNRFRTTAGPIVEVIDSKAAMDQLIWKDDVASLNRLMDEAYAKLCSQLPVYGREPDAERLIESFKNAMPSSFYINYTRLSVSSVVAWRTIEHGLIVLEDAIRDAATRASLEEESRRRKLDEKISQEARDKQRLAEAEQAAAARELAAHEREQDRTRANNEREEARRREERADQRLRDQAAGEREDRRDAEAQKSQRHGQWISFAGTLVTATLAGIAVLPPLLDRLAPPVVFSGLPPSAKPQEGRIEVKLSGPLPLDAHVVCQPQVSGILTAIGEDAWSVTALPEAPTPLRLYCRVEGEGVRSNVVTASIDDGWMDGLGTLTVIPMSERSDEPPVPSRPTQAEPGVEGTQ